MRWIPVAVVVVVQVDGNSRQLAATSSSTTHVACIEMIARQAFRVLCVAVSGFERVGL